MSNLNLFVVLFSHNLFENLIFLGVKNQENYTAPRMVLAASGVDHEELLSVAEPLLADLPSVPRSEEPKSTYVGGDFRRHGEEGVRFNFYITPFILSCISFFLNLSHYKKKKMLLFTC
jgi:hypothetical protein